MRSVLKGGQASEGAPAVAPDIDEEATEPRAGLLDDVIDELRWTLKGRKGWLVGLAANLASGSVPGLGTRVDPELPVRRSPVRGP
jgi:hypothetical protein